MKSKISTAILIAASLFSIKTIEQEHTNSWFRTTISIPVTEKIYRGHHLVLKHF